jgi:transcriptional regulator with XRE-family HTH domain
MATPRTTKLRWLDVPASLWRDPAVEATLVAADVGGLLRLVLAATGATQEALGNRVGMTQSEISGILLGKRTIATLNVMRSVVDGLDMPDHALDLLLLGVFGRNPRSAGAEEDPVNRREAIHQAIVAALASGVAVSGALGERVVSAAARRPDYTTADHLRAMLHQVRQLDDTAPIGSLVPMAAKLAAFARELLAAAPEQLRPDIGRVAAEAALAHWWQVWQADGDANAEAGRVLELATEWDMPAMVGFVLARRVWRSLTEGDPTAAVRLAHAARELRWGLSPGGVGWSAEYEARAHAIAGDYESMVRAIDIADESLAAIGPDTEPPWLYWMADRGLPSEKARVRLLADGPDAVPVMEAAMAIRPSDQVRDLSWLRADIAATRARAGDAEGAARDAETVIELASPAGATFVTGELVQLARRPHLTPLRDVLADHGIVA